MLLSCVFIFTQNTSISFFFVGYKYVFQPNLNRENCRLTRYQPFLFDTIGNSDCAFQKSLCSGEGQITYDNGNTTSDRTCLCDTDKRYTSLRSTKEQCYCNPSKEDCTCFIGIKSNNTMNSSKGEVKLLFSLLDQQCLNLCVNKYSK